MLVGDDDIVSWRKPFNTPLGSFHTCCRRQPTKAALMLHFENVELRHGVAVTKKQWVDTDIESQARLAVHKMRMPCLSSIILSPLNGNVKMSPYETGDIHV